MYKPQYEMQNCLPTNGNTDHNSSFTFILLAENLQRATQKAEEINYKLTINNKI